MLSYLLALTVGFGSFALYMAAFFLPELHRKYDLIWSGVGLFYALVLWVCAGRITGGLLLGQLASVALLGWFAWQTLALRRSQTPLDQQTPLPGAGEPLDTRLRSIGQQIQANFQQNFQQTPGYTSLPANWQQWQDQLTNAFATLQGWLEAFLSTTLKSTPPTSIDQSQPFPNAIPQNKSENIDRNQAINSDEPEKPRSIE